MPLDPLSTVVPGEPLQIPASVWNRLLEMVRREVGTRLGRSGGGPLGSTLTPALEVLVQNDTGGDLSRGAIVALGDPVTDADGDPFQFQGRPAFGGDVPTGTDDAIAILSEPIADGAIGRGIIAGPVVCSVNVSSTSHGYASPIAATTARLASTSYGPCRLIWTATGGTGIQDAVVWSGDRPGEASATTPGVVSLGDQTLGTGTKTVAGLYSPGDVQCEGLLACYGDTIILGDNAAGSVSIDCYFTGGDGSPADGSFYASVSGGNFTVGMSCSDGQAYVTGTGLTVESQSGTPIITLRNDTTNTNYAGQSTTTGGLTFTGGILTGGSFSGVASIDGGTTGLTFSGTDPATLGGTLVPANGGTGLATTPPAGSMLTGTGTGYSQESVLAVSEFWGVD